MTEAPELRQRLIEAATLLFADRGFDGVGLREIAKKAHANPAMISYHFGGKEGLYDAVLREGFARCPGQSAMRTSPALDPADPGARSFALSELRRHLHRAVEDMQVGQEPTPLDRAFTTLTLRELAESTPRMEALDREFMRPHFDHMASCFRILKPGLSEEESLQLCCAAIGPLLMCALLPGLMRLRSRGRPFPSDGRAFADFIHNHTLRALGVEGVHS